MPKIAALNPKEATQAIDHSGYCVSLLIGIKDARTATKYVSPKYTVKATRQWPHDGRARHATYIVTVGTPNYLERKFIAKCKLAKEPFPIKKVQIKYWPKKRVKKDAKKARKSR